MGKREVFFAAVLVSALSLALTVSVVAQTGTPQSEGDFVLSCKAVYFSGTVAEGEMVKLEVRLHSGPYGYDPVVQDDTYLISEVGEFYQRIDWAENPGGKLHWVAVWASTDGGSSWSDLVWSEGWLDCEPPPTPMCQTDLIAGQDWDSPAGVVTVHDDGEFLYVKYETSGDWSLGDVHLYVADSPPTHSAPGRFPYAGETEYQVPLEGLGVGCDDNDKLFIAAHAEVNRDLQEETAWADTYGTLIRDKGWAMYFGYLVSCGDVARLRSLGWLIELQQHNDPPLVSWTESRVEVCSCWQKSCSSASGLR
jgi:hypothetical protein